MRLAVRTNQDEVFAEMDEWVEQATSIAVPRTLNRLRDQAQTVGLRKVSEIYRIGPRTMEKFVATRFATVTAPQAELTVRGKGFPLYVFQPRQTAGGVSVAVKGRRFIVPHGFMPKLRSGHIGVFARGGYSGKWTANVEPTGEEFGRFVFGRKRLPINELFTMSPPDAFSNPDVTEAMNDRVLEQAPIVLQQELRFAQR